MQTLRRFLVEEDGPTAAEYAVMLALILMVVILAVGALGTTTSSQWGANDATLNIAWTAAGGS